MIYELLGAVAAVIVYLLWDAHEDRKAIDKAIDKARARREGEVKW